MGRHHQYHDKLQIKNKKTTDAKIDYLKVKTPPGYFKCKRQIGFYFPKTDDFRSVSENKNRFENRFEHPGCVLIFKCVNLALMCFKSSV